MLQNIIWDWNGTLLDDVWAVVEATNYSLQGYGVHELSIADYRRMFKRPIKSFHDALVGRPLSASEWQSIDRAYWSYYDKVFPTVQLASGAPEVLATADSMGLRQSLLSMTANERLETDVRRHGLERYFSLIEGRRPGDSDRKAMLLARHVLELDVYPESAVLIGDTIDDASSAKAVGVNHILVAACSFESGDRHSEVNWVASTLGDVIKLAATY
jgi:phosphoglycolate phosphatase-like HAD superfamily hydrolase